MQEGNGPKRAFFSFIKVTTGLVVMSNAKKDHFKAANIGNVLRRLRKHAPRRRRHLSAARAFCARAAAAFRRRHSADCRHQ